MRVLVRSVGIDDDVVIAWVISWLAHRRPPRLEGRAARAGKPLGGHALGAISGRRSAGRAAVAQGAGLAEGDQALLRLVPEGEAHAAEGLAPVEAARLGQPGMAALNPLLAAVGDPARQVVHLNHTVYYTYPPRDGRTLAQSTAPVSERGVTNT